MDNIQKRMNAFTALRDGSTTGDAELKDIRVAYDGKEYGNAGEAVREQASDIHKALFGAGASIWSKAKSGSTKYVAETKGICILNERFTAAGVVAKISRGTFAQNESTLNLDRECSAYIVEFEKNPGTVYMPSAETIKIVSTTKIIFEANGNARCWIPRRKRPIPCRRQHRHCIHKRKQPCALHALRSGEQNPGIPGLWLCRKHRTRSSIFPRPGI